MEKKKELEQEEAVRTELNPKATLLIEIFLIRFYSQRCAAMQLIRNY